MFCTLLFTPANDNKKILKALNLDVDVVILDLEDACALNEKEKASSEINYFASLPRNNRLYIRVNGIKTPYFFKDMQNVVSKDIDGIVIPMLEEPNEICIIEWYLSNLEMEQNIPLGSIDIIPIIETARGLGNLREILRFSKRIKRIAFGAGDFTNDIGMEWSKTSEEVLYARSKIVLESRIANIEAPIDTVYIDLNDIEHFKNETKHAKKMGFQGKLLIHPNQINPAKKIFAPSLSDIEQAKKIMKAFELAEKNGSSSIKVDGQFVDYPIYYKAVKIINLAKKFGIN
ncbi:HpcH/HpaI aldolase/citrate lyase family protein [Fredinandcohnia onubensis]|uniref:HpcH/HpaI aldolase/citrate lyase family protein n=1 Tax=Fredinandcohnia onubensis TaxID=1571209 RepID=UPI0015D4AA93|nr:CoA ester lyase [Fredinandcohnia onubensis]